MEKEAYHSTVTHSFSVITLISLLSKDKLCPTQTTQIGGQEHRFHVMFIPAVNGYS